jgi:hypothetical protein
MPGLPTPRVEVFPGRNGRWYSRLVKRRGQTTETGAGARERGWASCRGARRQARIDFPTFPVVTVDR